MLIEGKDIFWFNCVCTQC